MAVLALALYRDHTMQSMRLAAAIRRLTAGAARETFRRVGWADGRGRSRSSFLGQRRAITGQSGGRSERGFDTRLATVGQW